MTSDENSLPAQRKKNKEGKLKFRRDMLQAMPKGGTAVEIGVWKGVFSQMLLNQLRPEKLILIDPWKSFEERDAAFDGQTGDDEFETIYQGVITKYAPEISEGRVEVRRGLSGDVLAKLNSESLSFAYIDGDHSYTGVCADLASLWPLMKVGGVIMLDDYHRRGWWGLDVIQAANEFIGAHATKARIRAMRGAQLAIEKIET